MKRFSRILNYLSRYKGYAGLNIMFNLLSVVFSAFSIVMVIPFLELLFGQKPPQYDLPVFEPTVAYVIDYFYYWLSWFIYNKGNEQALLYICAVIAGVFLLKNVFQYLARYFMAPLRNGVARDLRAEVYRKVIVLPMSFFSKERRGDLITRMTTDVKEVEHSVLSVLEVLVKEPITVAVFLGVLLSMSAKLTLFVLIMLGVTALVIGQIGRRLKKQSTAGQQKMGLITSIIDETLGGLRVIKAFNAEGYQKQKFEEENGRLYRIMNRIFRRKDLSSPLTEFLAIITVAGVLWYGGNIVLTGQLGAPEFIGYILIFAMLIPPSKSFATAYYNVQKGMASMDRIHELMDADNDILDGPHELKDFEHGVEYKGVGFAYYNYDDKKVLEGINVKLEKGKMIALVGQSGAGKTTFADLLPRFYDVTEGEILLDGKNIREYKIGDLRRLMGVVTQNSILFNDTVANNIAFGREGASYADIERAAQIANAHEFISKLEHGYETVIGEQGNNLSGGERQRITIARAVLANPQILILDEATSSLDSESERQVQDALIKLMRNRTSIVIAHRLSTIQYADEILVMQDGHIVERGNHISLTAKNGLYKKLVDLQAF